MRGILPEISEEYDPRTCIHKITIEPHGFFIISDQEIADKKWRNEMNGWTEEYWDWYMRYNYCKHGILIGSAYERCSSCV